MKPISFTYGCAAIAVLALISPAGAQTPVTSSLDLWLEADAGVTANASGQVSAWADQSGNGHNGSQGNVNTQPVLVNNALNGHPVLRFNGAGDFLGLQGQVLNSQQFTVMAVVNDTRSSGDTTFREVFSNWSFTTFEQSVFLGTANTAPVRARFTDDMGGATDPLHTQTGFGNITDPATHFIFTGISGATDATIYQNGNLIADKGSPLSPRDLNVADGAYNVGTQGGGFEFWKGDIAELLVYDKALSTSEFQQNLTYLQDKYFTSSTPEPGSIALLTGCGLAGLATLRRSRRRK